MTRPDFPLPDALLRAASENMTALRAAAERENVVLPADADDLEMTYVFAVSDFAARTCIRRPALAADLIESGDLQRPYAAGAYQNKLAAALSGQLDEATLIRTLREVRQREMVRIAWRDIAGRADLEETMADLSHFADACLDRTLSILYEGLCARHGVPTGASGAPQRLAVIGMGKLGARELNFSSDVDLIFAFPEGGRTEGDGKTVTNDEFFLTLCRRLMQTLSVNTADGFVFRIDMNLRPYGESGPLAMNFDAMEEYYQRQGREWERYAWIKARASAGDADAGNLLLDRLRPFVYRRYLDYGVFNALRDMKAKIAAEQQRKGMKGNIKLGAGGIRDIEFFGQVFQLIRGGVVTALQERNILATLGVLAREGYIDETARRELTDAYRLLRRTEHRLQEYADVQTHQLPSGPTEYLRLAAAVGFDGAEAFSKALNRAMENVRRHFDGLLAVRDAGPDRTDIQAGLADVWKGSETPERCRDILSAAGFAAPDQAAGLLADLKNSPETRHLSSEGRERLDRLMPSLLGASAASRQPMLVLGRIIDLVKIVERRTNYLSLLLENPAAVARLIDFAEKSPWIMAFLARHPVLLDELIDPRTLYAPPSRADLERELDQMVAPDGDFEYQMEALRVFKQMNALRVAAADAADAIPLMKVSDHLSDIAETVLGKALDMAWRHLVEKHGAPACRLDGADLDRGFAVIAYGKLGGLELGYNSDLDLVFLHAGSNNGRTGGRLPADHGQFFARLGQRVVHILTAHTGAGVLYETDMRLRPSGSAGMLVCGIASFGDYQKNEAWTWEKQALIRARGVCGDAPMIRRFEEIRRDVLTQPRDAAELKEAVVSMRERMRGELLKNDPERFDLKQGAGGMVDVEFLVQYLILRHAPAHESLTRWTDNVRLLSRLAAAGALTDVEAYLLRKAYLTYRTMGHKLSLKDEPAAVPADAFRPLREAVGAIWRRRLG